MLPASPLPQRPKSASLGRRVALSYWNTSIHVNPMGRRRQQKKRKRKKNQAQDRANLTRLSATSFAEAENTATPSGALKRRRARDEIIS